MHLVRNVSCSECGKDSVVSVCFYRNAICHPCLEKALALFPKEEKWGCFAEIEENNGNPWNDCIEDECAAGIVDGKTKKTCPYWRKVEGE